VLSTNMPTCTLAYSTVQGRLSCVGRFYKLLSQSRVQLSM